MVSAPARIKATLACIVLAGSGLLAGFQANPLQDRELSGFGRLVRGNETFGRRLLHDVHSNAPGRNVVVAPLSVTLILAAIQESADYDIAKEIGAAFGWGTAIGGRALRLRVPAKMLLTGFDKGAPQPPSQSKFQYLYPPEGVWITNRVIYRTPGGGRTGAPPSSPVSSGFRNAGEKYFELRFESSGTQRPRGSGLGPSGLNPRNDVLISSSLHLATAWAGNTFSMSDPFSASFRVAEGIERNVTMLRSELEEYRHGKTDDFEAVALPCNRGYMIAVLPADGRSLDAVERLLVDRPEALDAALKPEFGIVTMPVFHTVFESDLSSTLRSFGIQAVFKNLTGLFEIPGSYLTEVRQAVDIQVDQSGIRADAGTVAGGIYGGVMGGVPQPFSMTLNRPFIFLVRESFSGALLFAGVVIDPSVR